MTGSRHPAEVGPSDDRDGKRPVDSVDAVASTRTEALDGNDVPAAAPPNWVPSQQDDRPRH